MQTKQETKIVPEKTRWSRGLLVVFGADGAILVAATVTVGIAIAMNSDDVSDVVEQLPAVDGEAEALGVVEAAYASYNNRDMEAWLGAAAVDVAGRFEGDGGNPAREGPQTFLVTGA